MNRKESILTELEDILKKSSNAKREFNRWKRHHPILYRQWLKTEKGKLYKLNEDARKYFIS